MLRFGICCLFLLGCTLRLKADESEYKKISENAFTAKVSKGDLSIEVDLAGTFVAEDKDEIRIEPKSYRGDLIITSLKAEGANVKKGDLLIEFDPSSLQRSLEDAQNDVSDKQVARDKAQADFLAAEIERETTLARNEKELEIAHREIAKAHEEIAFELKQNQKKIVDSKHRLGDGEIDLEQLKQLYEERELHTATENILIDRELRRIKDLENGLQKTIHEVEIWKKYDRTKTIEEKELDAAKKDADLRKAKIQLQADLNEKGAEVKKAERALEKALRKVRELEEDSQTLQVVSPRDGVVFHGTIGGGDALSSVVMIGMGGQDKEMRIGGRARTHQILMTVASMARLSIEMRVLENDIQHMKPNLPITIRPDAFPSLVMQGKLTTVDLIASRSGMFSEVREFTVTGEYEGLFPQLRSGMNCRVTVQADTVPDAIQVPVVAVFSEGGKFYCLVQNNGESSHRPVKLGATNGTMVEITEGLRSGETVSIWDPTEE